MARSIDDSIIMTLPLVWITVRATNLINAQASVDLIYKSLSADSSTLTIVVVGMWILYYAGFEALPCQATPGKMIMGITVTDANGHRLPLLKSIIRTIGVLVSLVTFGAGLIPMAFNPYKQTLHDMIAGSVVITRKPKEYHYQNPTPSKKETSR